MNTEQRETATAIIQDRYLEDVLSFVKHGDLGALNDFLKSILKVSEWSESRIIDHLNNDDLDDLNIT